VSTYDAAGNVVPHANDESKCKPLHVTMAAYSIILHLHTVG